jgi:hypothetical protein
MACSGEFMQFNELTDDLKRSIANNISNSKDFLRFMASGKTSFLTQKQVQAKLQKLNNVDYYRAIRILHDFTTECVELEKKFLNDKVRNDHLDMFINGYKNSALLEDENLFDEYNSTFEDLVDDLADTMRENTNTFITCQNTRILTEIINKLRFKKDLWDIAKQALFKQVEDDFVEHQLVLEFESGVIINVEITICNVAEDPMRSIDVNASFVTKKSNKQHKHAYVISGENEDFDSEDDDAFDADMPRWIINDPTEWVGTVLKKLKQTIDGTSMLGGVKNINYKYTGQQFWVKAYFLLEVLPEFANM